VTTGDSAHERLPDKGPNRSREASDDQGLSDYRLRDVSPPWLPDHLTLLASATVSALLVVRLMQVSRFRTATALSLLGTGNPVLVVFGLFVSLLPTISLFLGALLIVYVVDRLKLLLHDRMRAAAAARILQLVMIALLAAVYLSWLSVLVLLSVGGLAMWTPRARMKEWFLQLVLSYALLLFIYFLANQTVWLAPEVIHLREEGQIVAYTVEDEGPWTTLLTEEERVIRFVRSANVLDRTVCELESQRRSRTLFEMVRQEPNPTPSCPEAS
jgi:hypothetical protein